MNTDPLPTEPAATDRPPTYRSFLLRFWEERGEMPAPPVWRFSLEDPQTAHRQGFASLTALTDWLQSQITQPDAPPTAAPKAT